MSRPKQEKTNQATKAPDTAFDFAKWKPTAQRKWENYNVSVQFKKLVTAWKTGVNVQECANDLLYRLKKTSYKMNDKGSGADLQKMATGQLKPTLTAASSRGLPPGTTDYLQVTGDRDDLKTKNNTDAREGASGGTKELNPSHLGLQTQWFGDMLRWLTPSLGEDDERRIQQPEIPDGLKLHSDSYTYIRALSARLHPIIREISTPVVQSVTKIDQATETSVEVEEHLKKSERTELEKEISSLEKNMSVFDDRLSKLLTSLGGSEEENKKEKMENITASQLNVKIDRCQQLAKWLQDNRRGINANVTKVYVKHFGIKDARELPTAIDMLQYISDVLTKQETSLRMSEQATETKVKVEEHLTKRDRKQFEKEISSMEKDMSVIDARLSNLLTSLDSEEENKKEKMGNTSASQLNVKIDRCQRLATRLQQRCRGINTNVTRVYKQFVIRDARELPTAIDMIQHISDVLTKQETSLRRFKDTEGNRSTLREYCKTFNELNDKLSEQVRKPQRLVPAADESLPVISFFILTAVKDIEKSISTHMQNTTKQIDKLQQENANIKWKTESQQGMIHGLKDERQQLQQEMRKIDVEREELLCRLSKFASAKLTLDNPNITDLSDTDRPIKLAERYSELYDNEWTDAFQALTDKLEYDDRNAIDTLLDIITGVSQHCATIGQQQQLDIRMAISYPASRGRDNREHVKLPDHHGKTVADIVKDTADISEKDLLSTYILQREHVPTCDPNVLAQKECRSYRDRCVNLCWKMALQNPPVYLEGTLTERSTFDTKLYKPYQTTGKKVAYLIWPALFLHQGGTLLMKGVAEGMKK